MERREAGEGLGEDADRAGLEELFDGPLLGGGVEAGVAEEVAVGQLCRPAAGHPLGGGPFDGEAGGLCAGAGLYERCGRGCVVAEQLAPRGDLVFGEEVVAGADLVAALLDVQVEARALGLGPVALPEEEADVGFEGCLVFGEPGVAVHAEDGLVCPRVGDEPRRDRPERLAERGDEGARGLEDTGVEPGPLALEPGPVVVGLEFGEEVERVDGQAEVAEAVGRAAHPCSRASSAMRAASCSTEMGEEPSALLLTMMWAGLPCS